MNQNKGKRYKRNFKGVIFLFVILIVIALIYLYNSKMQKNETIIIQSIAGEELIPKINEQILKDVSEINESYEIESVSDIEIIENSIYSYMEKNEIDLEVVSLVIEDLETEQKISISGDEENFAASIYKLPLALIYYDLINNGEIELTDKYQFLAEHQESVGVLESKYSFGDYISLQYLLEIMIKYSDNSAAHILFENLGGWEEFKELATIYVDLEYSEDFIEKNILSAEYTNSLLVYIYNNEEKYIELIEDMCNASPEEYLDIDESIEIAQKYGWYNKYVNSVGIIYSSSPYTISIFTELEYDEAIEFIGDINEICLDTFSI